MKYDVIIAGLGAMGSAAAFHCARHGLNVLGLDQFHPPHSLGSSHGQTRIIREACFEHPSYVPLVQRAYELWDELERVAGEKLLRPTGGLMIGSWDGKLVQGARRSAELHGLAFEILSAHEVLRRFPALQPADDMTAVHERRAGVLFVERCVRAHLAAAQQNGACLRLNEKVEAWEPSGDGVCVRTTQGEYAAEKMVLAAGPWLKRLMPEASGFLRVERQVQFWFEPKEGGLFAPDACPIYLFQHGPHDYFYGFPDLGDGVKVARHHQGAEVDPESVPRGVTEEDTAAMRDLVERFLPGASGRVLNASVCLYTNTADEHFWIDFHPRFPQVLVASPCSGHGFKFSSVVGEVCWNLLTGVESGFDLGLFRSRF